MLIPKDENRNQPLRKLHCSVRNDLQKALDGTKKTASKRRKLER